MFILVFDVFCFTFDTTFGVDLDWHNASDEKSFPLWLKMKSIAFFG